MRVKCIHAFNNEGRFDLDYQANCENQIANYRSTMVQSIFTIHYLRNYLVSYVSTRVSINILFYIQVKKINC